MSFWVVRKELMNTYLFAVCAGFSRMAAVAKPTVERRAKLVSALPESKILAVLVFRSKPKKPSSRPLEESEFSVRARKVVRSHWHLM